jgi:hypothetical protein
MKMLVAVTAVLVCVASPAFAQPYRAGYVPHYGYRSEGHYGVRTVRRPGERAYAMVRARRINPNSPALTGGGSLGYNGPLDLYYR